jgi:SnoaL-like domain
MKVAAPACRREHKLSVGTSSVNACTVARSTDLPLQESSDEGSVPVGQNESLVVDRTYETWNSGDVSGLQELYAADADVAIPGATVRGRDQVGALWGAFISAFPDGQLTELLRLDCGT